jgi:heptosyltransferase-2
MGMFLSLRIFGPWLSARRLVARLRRRTGREPFSILVIRLDDIGDVVLFTPFLRELRRLHPSARIGLVVKPLTFDLVELCPSVDEVLVFRPWRDYRGGYARKYRDLLAFCLGSLWRRHYDLAIHPRWDCDYYNAYHLLYLSGAPRRLAYPEAATSEKRGCNRGCDRLATELVPPAEGGHEVHRSLAVIRYLGGVPGSDGLELWLSDDDRAFADSLFATLGIPGKARVVVLAIGARHSAKRWPAQRFVALGRRLLEDEAVQLLLVGGMADREACEGLARELGGRVFNLAGSTRLRQTAAILAKSTLFIGNDSGPKHIAAAMRVPIVEVSAYPANGEIDHFLSPSRFGPWGTTALTIHPAVAAFSETSIEAVPVEEVLDAALRMLRAAVEGQGGSRA